MSSKRVQACQEVFEGLDPSGAGKVDVSEISRTFSTQRHPDILLKRKTEDDVTYEFLDTLETFVGNGNDRHIDLNQWLNFYALVGSNVESDDFFELMVRNSFQLE
jgi:hypothetical protein